MREAAGSPQSTSFLLLRLYFASKKPKLEVFLGKIAQVATCPCQTLHTRLKSCHYLEEKERQWQNNASSWWTIMKLSVWV